MQGSTIKSHEKVHAWLDSVNHSMEGLSGSDVTFALSSNSCDLEGKPHACDRAVDAARSKTEVGGRQRRGRPVAKRYAQAHPKQ